LDPGFILPVLIAQGAEVWHQDGFSWLLRRRVCQDQCSLRSALPFFPAGRRIFLVRRTVHVHGLILTPPPQFCATQHRPRVSSARSAGGTGRTLELNVKNCRPSLCHSIKGTGTLRGDTTLASHMQFAVPCRTTSRQCRGSVDVRVVLVESHGGVCASLGGMRAGSYYIVARAHADCLVYPSIVV
jgi:hypothetical protein